MSVEQYKLKVNGILMKKALMFLPINERYDLIRSVYSSVDNNMQKSVSILGISRNTVYNAISNLSVCPRIYEKKLKDEHLTYIHIRSIEEPHITGNQLSKEIFNLFHISITGRTINLYRNRLGLCYRPPIRSVKLSASAKEKRLAFTAFHLQNKTNFKNVIFTDEAWFQLDRNKRWVWVDKSQISEKVMSNHVSHPQKVMVWGGIGYNFKTNIVFIEDTLDADAYIDQVIFGSNLIEHADEVYGIGKWLLQQDNAPAHVSYKTIQVLKELEIKLLENWPPYSPDLNIIEVVWAIMENRVEVKGPNSIDGLKKVVRDVWDSLSNQTINGLVDSIDRRLNAVHSKPDQTIYYLSLSK